MAQDPRKRQQKLARKSAKRKTKQQLVSRQQSAGIVAQLELAAKYPIVDCLVTGELSGGICSILVSRRLPNGSMAVATFLVDLFCLGIKDAWVRILSNYQYIDKSPQMLIGVKMAPAAARKLVEEAADYARSIGFDPHPDYRKAKLLLADIDASECTQEFEFGDNGKPYFFAGPHDTEKRCLQIIKTLKRTCGEGNFHFTIPAPDSLVRTLPNYRTATENMIEVTAEDE